MLALFRNDAAKTYVVVSASARNSCRRCYLHCAHGDVAPPVRVNCSVACVLPTVERRMRGTLCKKLSTNELVQVVKMDVMLSNLDVTLFTSDANLLCRAFTVMSLMARKLASVVETYITAGCTRIQLRLYLGLVALATKRLKGIEASEMKSTLFVGSTVVGGRKFVCCSAIPTSDRFPSHVGGCIHRIEA